MTKYIVDNVTNQTITGNIRIDGDLKVIINPSKIKALSKEDRKEIKNLFKK